MGSIRVGGGHRVPATPGAITKESNNTSLRANRLRVVTDELLYKSRKRHEGEQGHGTGCFGRNGCEGECSAGGQADLSVRCTCPTCRLRPHCLL